MLNALFFHGRSGLQLLPALQLSALQLLSPYRRIAMSMLPTCSMPFDPVAAVPSHAHPAASPLLRPAGGDWLRHDGADELDRLRVRRIDSHRSLQP